MTYEEAQQYVSGTYIYGDTTREEHNQVEVAHWATKIETAPGVFYGLISANEEIPFLADNQLHPQAE